ncbi:MAG TPA: hypothetical protein VGK87_10060 [Anaerolineae bacterium]|jgi:hypothetical protein
MKRTTYLLFGCVIAVVAAIGVGYGLIGSWVGGAFAIGFGGVWLLTHLSGYHPAVAVLMWLCLTGIAAIGIVLGLSSALMLIAVVAALCAWDIAHYEQQFDAVSRIDNSDALDRAHYMRLALTALISLALGAVALLIRVNLSFALALVIALMAVILLGQLVRVALRS